MPRQGHVPPHSESKIYSHKAWPRSHPPSVIPRDPHMYCVARFAFLHFSIFCRVGTPLTFVSYLPAATLPSFHRFPVPALLYHTHVSPPTLPLFVLSLVLYKVYHQQYPLTSLSASLLWDVYATPIRMSVNRQPYPIIHYSNLYISSLQLRSGVA